MNDRRSLGDLVESVRAGFWGSNEQCFGSMQARVIRNGDAASSVELEELKLPIRWVSRRQLADARVLPDDIILVSSGEVGRVSRLSGQPELPIIASNFVRRLRSARDVHPRWLFHVLSSEISLAAARQASAGTTIQNLSWRSFQNWEINVPSYPEQRRVAEIVDALDKQIKMTEQIAAKLRRSFAGLMDHLFTCGVSKPSRSTRGSIDRTVQTGSMPKNWMLLPVERLLAPVNPAIRSGPFGSALLKRELVAEGVPLLGIDNVQVGRFVADFRRFVTSAKASELSRYLVRPQDVMVTIMGTVGRSCLVPEGIGPALSSKHVWTMTLDQEICRPYLISLQLNHAPWIRAQLRKDEQGGVMGAIRSETLKSLLIPVPPIGEQLEIEKVLKSVESRIVGEEELLKKLHSLKAGLLNDFLRTRISVSGEANK